MEYEVCYTRIVEAEDFFDAIQYVKDTLDNVEEVVSVCPAAKEDMWET